MLYWVPFAFLATALCSTVDEKREAADFTDCANYFRKLYQNDVHLFDSRGENWRFLVYYDYFGNRLSRKPDMPNPLAAAELEREINRQINRHLFAQYTFLSMASHFYRMHLLNTQNYFRSLSAEETNNANKLIDYLLKRGGQLKLAKIMRPCRHNWGDTEATMKEALTIHTILLQSMTDIHTLAGAKRDPQVTDFIERNFIKTRTDHIHQASTYIDIITRKGGTELVDIQFDRFYLKDDDED